MVCGARPRFGTSCGRSGRCEVAQVTGGLGLTTCWVHAHISPRHGSEVGQGSTGIWAVASGIGDRVSGSGVQIPGQPVAHSVPHPVDREICMSSTQASATCGDPRPHPSKGLSPKLELRLLTVTLFVLDSARDSSRPSDHSQEGVLGTLRVRGAVSWRVMWTDCDRRCCPLEPPGQRASVHGCVTWPQESEGRAEVTAQPSPGRTGSWASAPTPSPLPGGRPEAVVFYPPLGSPGWKGGAQCAAGSHPRPAEGP